MYGFCCGLAVRWTLYLAILRLLNSGACVMSCTRIETLWLEHDWESCWGAQHSAVPSRTYLMAAGLQVLHALKQRCRLNSSNGCLTAPTRRSWHGVPHLSLRLAPSRIRRHFMWIYWTACLGCKCSANRQRKFECSKFVAFIMMPTLPPPPPTPSLSTSKFVVFILFFRFV